MRGEQDLHARVSSALLKGEQLDGGFTLKGALFHSRGFSDKAILAITTERILLIDERLLSIFYAHVASVMVEKKTVAVSTTTGSGGDSGELRLEFAEAQSAARAQQALIRRVVRAHRPTDD